MNIRHENKQCYIPSSGVTIVKTVLKGPIPTVVLAAMMHRYVVYGLRVVTVIDVVVEVN